ncbi:hypothetical protein QNZ73_004576 [Vibrio parahaemolyticus]|uniref:hypothetical protein n=1 Tax=Vibrio TaxID=662 RepID=UPI002160E157|nr:MULTISPECIES: hypothetical protein [Vibrio]ELB2078566.1 hypothetical protein [Vibrio parahaemolyticus]ELB2100046.1 hypothetical protein [Vibrio parahaemolyticus]ELB2209745.1 hypothetical protein [Vibrio parahaemolyticus]ELB2291666.1 hypothetical protein [Vibrio parahaemolyticus]MCR9497421.1 hypothetical protein [Vibrio alginolyticus]
MKVLTIILATLFSSFAMAASVSELLVDNLKHESKSYTCNVTNVDTLDYQELVVCVKGRDMRAIELINLWVANFTAKNSTEKEHTQFVVRANELIKGATYVLSIKNIKGEYMTAFCTDCESIESASLLNDKSSFVFDSLRQLAKPD